MLTKWFTSAYFTRKYAESDISGQDGTSNILNSKKKPTQTGTPTKPEGFKVQIADCKYWIPVISHMSPRRQTAPTGREDREYEPFYLETDGGRCVRGISQNKPKWWHQAGQQNRPHWCTWRSQGSKRVVLQRSHQRTVSVNNVNNAIMHEVQFTQVNITQKYLKLLAWETFSKTKKTDVVAKWKNINFCCHLGCLYFAHSNNEQHLW